MRSLDQGSILRPRGANYVEFAWRLTARSRDVIQLLPEIQGHLLLGCADRMHEYELLSSA